MTRRVGPCLASIAALAVFAAAASAGASGESGSGGSGCVEAGLAAPQIVEAAMTHPGDHYTQTILLEFKPPELSAECQQRFELPMPRYQFQIQDHLRHSRWISVNPFRSSWHSPRRHRTLFAYWGIQKGHGVKKPMAKRRLYQCSPGKAVTEVRALLEQSVVELASGETVRSRTVAIPVRVKPVRAKLKHRGALRGPC